MVMLFFGFQTPRENKYTKTHTQWSVQRAKEVAHVFTKSNIRQSHKLVKWNEFQFNGEDFGKKYRETDSPTEKKKIIAGIFLTFNKGMKPPPSKPTPKSKDKTTKIATSMPAKDSVKDSEKTGKSTKKSVPKKPDIPRLINWRLASSPSSQTVVKATNSANKNRFVFTFNVGGMLIQLEINEYQKK